MFQAINSQRGTGGAAFGERWEAGRQVGDMEKKGGKEGFWGHGPLEPGLRFCEQELAALSVGFFQGFFLDSWVHQCPSSLESGVQPLLQNLYQSERCWVRDETWMLDQLMV